MPRVHGVRERRHQPVWDTLVRSTGAPATTIGPSTRLFGNAGTDAGVDDEILAEAFGQGKVIPCTEVTDGGQVSQCGHGGRPFRVNKNQFCPASAVAALTALLICGSVSSV